MKKKFDIKDIFSGKATKHGGFMAVVCAVAIAVVVVLNILVGEIPANITKIDKSHSGMYSIGEETKSILAGLDEDITLYLADKSDSYGEAIYKMLEQYEAATDRITLKQVDLAADPTFAQTYGSGGTISANSVVVECGDRNRLVDASEIFVEDYTYYNYNGTVEYYYDGEYAVTSAIYFVTADDIPSVYTLSGHGEAALADNVAAAIEKNSMSIKDLPLISMDAVPADADCVFINAPSQDISADEAKKLLAYLEDGGDLMLLSAYSGTKMPNLMSVMESYGVYPEYGIAMEGDSSRCISGYPYYLLPHVEAHDAAAIDTDLSYVIQPLTHGIGINENVRSTVEVTPITNTSDSAYLKVNAFEADTLEKEEGDTDGPIVTGVAITETYGGEQTNIVWYASGQMLDSEIDTVVGGNNTTLVITGLSWMCDIENPLTIASKSFASDSLTHTGLGSFVWMIVLMVILPAAFVVIGLVIWLKRRKK